jgi:membrane-associated protease RseP (regulator of RpoE activity)
MAQGSARLTETGPRTWLGVGADEVGDDVRAQVTLAEGAGLIVRHVEPDSPAAKAGIQENDILTKLGDQLLVNSDQLKQLIQMHKEGEAVTLTGLRKGKAINFKASLVKKEVSDQEPQFGVINLDGSGSGIKMEIPDEIRKLIEQHQGAGTVFSTNVSFFSVGKSSDVVSSDTGISSLTKNGQTTVTYKGKQVFSGPTTGAISTQSVIENDKEWAAVFDGKKVLWENVPGAARHLTK